MKKGVKGKIWDLLFLKKYIKFSRDRMKNVWLIKAMMIENKQKGKSVYYYFFKYLYKLYTFKFLKSFLFSLVYKI